MHIVWPVNLEILAIYYYIKGKKKKTSTRLKWFSILYIYTEQSIANSLQPFFNFRILKSINHHRLDQTPSRCLGRGRLYPQQPGYDGISSGSHSLPILQLGREGRFMGGKVYHTSPSKPCATSRISLNSCRSEMCRLTVAPGLVGFLRLVEVSQSKSGISYMIGKKRTIYIYIYK